MNSMSGSTGYGRLSGAGSSNMKENLAGYQKGKVNIYDPAQMGLYQQQFGVAAPDSYLSRLASGDPALMEEMERPSLQQFGELQGNIASRFSGMGMGGRRSSGFQNTMGQASSDFAQQLQSNRQNLQRQAIQDLMGYSNQILGQRPYETFRTEKKQPWWKKLMGGGLQLACGALGGALGGPGGSALGSQLGQLAGSTFEG